MKFMNLVFLSLIASCGAVAFMGGSMHEAKNINTMVVRQEKLAQNMQKPEEKSSAKKKKRAAAKREKSKHGRGALKVLLSLSFVAISACCVGVWLGLNMFGIMLGAIFGFPGIFFTPFTAEFGIPVFSFLALSALFTYSAYNDFTEYKDADIKVAAL